MAFFNRQEKSLYKLATFREVKKTQSKQVDHQLAIFEKGTNLQKMAVLFDNRIWEIRIFRYIWRKLDVTKMGFVFSDYSNHRRCIRFHRHRCCGNRHGEDTLFHFPCNFLDLAISRHLLSGSMRAPI